MYSKIVFVCCICFFTNQLLGQPMDSLIMNLWQPKETSENYFKSLSFELKETHEQDGCLINILLKNEERLTLNYCNESTDSLSNFTYQFREIEKYNRLLEEFRSGGWEDFTFERKYLAGYTSFVYTDSYENEITFRKMVDLDLYFITISGYPAFEDNKAWLEEKLDFDESKHFITLLRKIVTTKNASGQTIESEVRPLVDIPSPLPKDMQNFILEVRENKNFSKIQKIVDEKFIGDKAFLKEVYSKFGSLELAAQENYDMERTEKHILHMMIDNDLIGSLVALKYLFEKLNK